MKAANINPCLFNTLILAHLTAKVEAVAAPSAPPTLDNGLIHGTNTYNNSGIILGSRFETTFKSGTRYGIRPHRQSYHGGDCSNFVPIVPCISDAIAIDMGQRYDIIITANAAVDSYYTTAVPPTVCSKNVNKDRIYSIIRYAKTSIDNTTSVRWANASTDELCENELMSSLISYRIRLSNRRT
ncbi:hypothetical protein BOTNAR_0611g00080 [Botryotinia narcissicola]|uniref:Plastocyanin-like domain-containing protein n=1 Tax=Botryotinia narcissicola TaxID=278944 RepID=A0A4Z1HCT5_9HELO|nr:hypothetical protein BOTNAR_0611g00080 [Botryotinia narcissicola]